MNPFEVGSYSDLSRTEEGRRLTDALWSFLNEKEIIIRLETTTYLKRPALEGIQPQLEERFDDELKALKKENKLDRWKQMLGRMTRQLLVEDLGRYEVDKKNVRVRMDGIFTTATRYKSK